MKWLPDLETGIEIIDNQHKSLVAHVDKLMALLKNPTDKAVEENLFFFVEYASTHFMCEEKMMAEIDYPELEEHKKHHTAFMQKLVKFRLVGKTDNAATLKELFDSALDWLVNHICGWDKKMAAYYREYKQTSNIQ